LRRSSRELRAPVVNIWLLLAVLGGLAATGLYVALYKRLGDVFLMSRCGRFCSEWPLE
jgi:hypothetical protein